MQSPKKLLKSDAYNILFKLKIHPNRYNQQQHYNFLNRKEKQTKASTQISREGSCRDPLRSRDRHLEVTTSSKPILIIFTEIWAEFPLLFFELPKLAKPIPDNPSTNIRLRISKHSTLIHIYMYTTPIYMFPNYTLYLLLIH